MFSFIYEVATLRMLVLPQGGKGECLLHTIRRQYNKRELYYLIGCEIRAVIALASFSLVIILSPT